MGPPACFEFPYFFNSQTACLTIAFPSLKPMITRHQHNKRKQLQWRNERLERTNSGEFYLFAMHVYLGTMLIWEISMKISLKELSALSLITTTLAGPKKSQAQRRRASHRGKQKMCWISNWIIWSDPLICPCEPGALKCDSILLPTPSLWVEMYPSQIHMLRF